MPNTIYDLGLAGRPTKEGSVRLPGSESRDTILSSLFSKAVNKNLDKHVLGG